MFFRMPRSRAARPCVPKPVLKIEINRSTRIFSSARLYEGLSIHRVRLARPHSVISNSSVDSYLNTTCIWSQRAPTPTYPSDPRHTGHAFGGPITFQGKRKDLFTQAIHLFGDRKAGHDPATFHLTDPTVLCVSPQPKLQAPKPESQIHSQYRT